ncbi:hypothetical protein DRE_04897 [Drechslerella stenobrocha 248]|uniref:Uncharacterized protein n=1 Tax=Drechslerella stenobrocha 248 TaxID=1043628 RepID=W7IA10_9PEZI|nr:hypothetical protein DRE_04897 [Drechslerella stenobrocha 248]
MSLSKMTVLREMVGCCGRCTRSEKPHEDPQDGSAVIIRQPLPVEPPMVVRAYKSIKHLMTPRRFPKPTLEQLEALYQEGKELVRLQEEAEKLRLEQEAGEYETPLFAPLPVRVGPPPVLLVSGPYDCENTSQLAPIPEHDDGRLTSDFALDVADVLARPTSIVFGPRSARLGTQTAKKIKMWFQDNSSSIYPSNESSMVYPDGAWTPEPPRPVQSIIPISKIRKVSRNISPGNLLIRPIFQVLEQSRASLVPPALRSRLGSDIELAELPHPDNFALDGAPSADDGPACLPDPAEFEFTDVALTPPMSPKIEPVPPKSPILQGGAYLKKELERIKKRIETGTFDATPWDKAPSPPAPALASTGVFTRVLNGVTSMTSLGSFGSSTSSISCLGSNLSLQPLGSQNSGVITPSSASLAEQVSAGLPQAAQSPARHEDVAVEAAATGLAGTVARGLSNGLSSLLRRLGARQAGQSEPAGALAKPQPEPQPEPPTQAAVPMEAVTSVESFVGVSPPLSPTPSNLELMRVIVGRKVDGTLRAPGVAAASPELTRLPMSSGLLTVDYTDTLSAEYLNQFEGFHWDAPDGKIPWYCDENGVHFDEKVMVGLKNYPSELLRDPKMPWDEESVKSPRLPAALSTGAKGVRVRHLTSPVMTSLASSGPSSASGAVALRSPRPTSHRAGSLSNSSSVSQFPAGSPRYDPAPHRYARTSTCGLDLRVERAFYMSYEDRLKQAMKPWMRGRPSSTRN